MPAGAPVSGGQERGTVARHSQGKSFLVLFSPQETGGLRAAEAGREVVSSGCERDHRIVLEICRNLSTSKSSSPDSVIVSPLAGGSSSSSTRARY